MEPRVAPQTFESTRGVPRWPGRLVHTLSHASGGTMKREGSRPDRAGDYVVAADEIIG
jgi:hypothetical protein